ncbi:SUKH-3 domain-containing protein [Streptomyces capparidis]
MSTTTRFPQAVDTALRAAGWQPGRWDIRQAEGWADLLRAYVSPGGHRHSVFPAAVEVWAEFGGLTVEVTGAGREVARTPFTVDPLRGLHLARTFDDLGRALDSRVCPLGEEGEGQAVLAIDAEGRVYSLDHTGDWYLGATFDLALSTLVVGLQPARLTADAT